MRYQLPRSVSFCWVDGRAVFLDLRRDRYFCLADRLDAAFRALAETEGEAQPDTADLARLGLVEPAMADARPIRACAEPSPSVSALASGPDRGRPPIRMMIETAWRLSRARAAARRRLQAASAGAQPIERALVPAAGALARIFDAARRRLPIERACLGDSFALIDFLRARQVEADLILGVRLHPFKAHAWVQLGPVALSDSLEALAGLTPIRRLT